MERKASFPSDPFALKTIWVIEVHIETNYCILFQKKLHSDSVSKKSWKIKKGVVTGRIFFCFFCFIFVLIWTGTLYVHVELVILFSIGLCEI